MRRVFGKRFAESQLSKNALQPALYLFGIAMAGTAWVTAQTGQTPIWMVVVVCGLGITATFGFIWFVFKDPDRLHSEGYLIRNQALAVLEQNANEFRVESTSISDIVSGHERTDT